MTNKEAINRLKSDIYKYADFQKNPNEGKFWEAFDMAIKALEQEPTWIPVSERLPEEGVDVLACFYTSEGDYKMMVSRRSDCNYWNGVGRTSDMVAWMPLPKPYKAESEEV